MKPAWSLTVRVTHWLVAAGVLFNMFNETGYTHRTIGYVCLVIIFIRIVHGLQKNALHSSRFSFPKLNEIKQHLKDIAVKNVRQHQGHNPLGMLAIYMMWIVIALLAFTGWLSRTDAFWGEDAPVLIHQILSYLLLTTVFIHVMAVLMMSKLEKRNLIKQMIHVKRR